MTVVEDDFRRLRRACRGYGRLRWDVPAAVGPTRVETTPGRFRDQILQLPQAAAGEVIARLLALPTPTTPEQRREDRTVSALGVLPC